MGVACKERVWPREEVRPEKSLKVTERCGESLLSFQSEVPCFWSKCIILPWSQRHSKRERQCTSVYTLMLKASKLREGNWSAQS